MLLLISVIDDKDNRDVKKVDIPNEFVKTEMGDTIIHMRIRGKLSEIMVSTEPYVYQ